MANFWLPITIQTCTKSLRKYRLAQQSDIITAAVLAEAGRFALLLLLYCQRLTDAYQPRTPN